jgi:hypothetical protein
MLLWLLVWVFKAVAFTLFLTAILITANVVNEFIQENYKTARIIYRAIIFTSTTLHLFMLKQVPIFLLLFSSAVIYSFYPMTNRIQLLDLGSFELLARLGTEFLTSRVIGRQSPPVASALYCGVKDARGIVRDGGDHGLFRHAGVAGAIEFFDRLHD